MREIQTLKMITLYIINLALRKLFPVTLWVSLYVSFKSQGTLNNSLKKGLIASASFGKNKRSSCSNLSRFEIVGVGFLVISVCGGCSKSRNQGFSVREPSRFMVEISRLH